MIERAAAGNRALNWRADRSGFSLLELVITMALIATLSAMVVPALFDARERGKIVEASTMIAAISLDLQRYSDLNGRYPNSLGEARRGSAARWILGGSSTGTCESKAQRATRVPGRIDSWCR